MLQADLKKRRASARMRSWRANNPKKAKRAHRRAQRALMKDPVRLAKKRAYARERMTKLRRERARHVLDLKLRSRYGITLEKFESLLKAQKGRCWICRKRETTRSCRGPALRRLSIDHCHKKGHVRGLLCAKCNKGLGLFLHSVPSLRRAIEYLGV